MGQSWRTARSPSSGGFSSGAFTIAKVDRLASSREGENALL